MTCMCAFFLIADGVGTFHTSENASNLRIEFNILNSTN